VGKSDPHSLSPVSRTSVWLRAGLASRPRSLSFFRFFRSDSPSRPFSCRRRRFSCFRSRPQDPFNAPPPGDQQPMTVLAGLEFPSPSLMEPSCTCEGQWVSKGVPSLDIKTCGQTTC